MRQNEYLWSKGLKTLQTTVFKLMKMVESYQKAEENTVGKEEIARYEQFLFFPQCFQKTCSADEG